MDRLHKEELQALRPHPLTEAAVLLVGHGSQLSSDSSRPIHDLILRLRELGHFREVWPAFWKEEPQLHHAFDLVESPEVFVVPMFMGEGYFTDRVLPRELGLDGQITIRDGLRIHYCPPVGRNRRMAQLVLDRAEEAVSLSREAQAETTLVVVGHGTDRHPRSADTTRSVVGELREKGPYARVVPAFLDQEPALARVLQEDPGPNIIVVPFFVSAGWHVGTTIPRDFPVERRVVETTQRRTWYAEPVGTHDGMVEVVLDLVAQGVEADSPKEDGPGEHNEPAARGVDGKPVASEAKRWFIGRIRSAPSGRCRFLQTVVWESESGVFEIRHERDRDAVPGALKTIRDPSEAFQIARATAHGSHRRLSTAPDLGDGWRLTGLTEEEVWEAYAALYPAALVHSYLGEFGQFSVVSFPVAADRHTGIYSKLTQLSEAQVGSLADSCCVPDRCLRSPTWLSRSDPGESEASGPGGAELLGTAASVEANPDEYEFQVPCSEPCSVLLSQAVRTLDPPTGSR